MVHELWGTFGGRWFVWLFAAAYVYLGWRLLGWRRLGIYTLVAFVVAVASENLSVRYGFPYTHYTFNEALRGDEIWIGDVPLFVPASYTFVMFFCFFGARAVAAGPWRRVPPSRIAAYALAVVFATWATWTLDPVSQRGAEWYMGDLFHYSGSGFWFGLPFGSQVGWFGVGVVLCGVLALLTRSDRPLAVRPRHNPQLAALAVFAVQVLHVSVVALAVGEHTLGAAGLLIWIPVVAVVAVLWPQLRPHAAQVTVDVAGEPEQEDARGLAASADTR